MLKVFAQSIRHVLDRTDVNRLCAIGESEASNAESTLQLGLAYFNFLNPLASGDESRRRETARPDLDRIAFERVTRKQVIE